jgi:hypothetical protein
MGEYRTTSIRIIASHDHGGSVLSVSVPGKPFLLYTDASSVAVGCQLAQLDDQGTKRPLGFASQKLSATQGAWSVTEREAYAVVWALNRFRNMVFGAPITVFADHNPPEIPLRGGMQECEAHQVGP